jgi:hypothetical protein
MDNMAIEEHNIHTFLIVKYIFEGGNKRTHNEYS